MFRFRFQICLDFFPVVVVWFCKPQATKKWCTKWSENVVMTTATTTTTTVAAPAIPRQSKFISLINLSFIWVAAHVYLYVFNIHSAQIHFPSENPMHMNTFIYVINGNLANPMLLPLPLFHLCSYSVVEIGTFWHVSMHISIHLYLWCGNGVFAHIQTQKYA